MKRMICMVLVFALIAAPSALAEGHRELENYTRYFDYQLHGVHPGLSHQSDPVCHSQGTQSPGALQESPYQA